MSLFQKLFQRLDVLSGTTLGAIDAIGRELAEV